MLETLKSTILFVSALLPIVNPVSSTPIFLLLTSDSTFSTRVALARRIALNSFFLLVFSYFVGARILAFFGISLPVVQVGGGLVVISTGWVMLTQAEGGRHEHSSGHTVDPEDIFKNAFYPLTMPLTVGPGSISIAITLGANSSRHPGFDLPPIVGALIGSLLLALTVFLCYGSADRLARLVGPTGMS